MTEKPEKPEMTEKPEKPDMRGRADNLGEGDGHTKAATRKPARLLCF